MGTCGSTVRRNKKAVATKDSNRQEDKNTKPSNMTETQPNQLPMAGYFYQADEISSKEEEDQSEENNVEVYEKEENTNKEHSSADKRAVDPTGNFDGNTELINDNIFKGKQQVYLMEGPFSLKPTFGISSELHKSVNRPLKDVDDWLVELKKIVDDEIKTIDETNNEITN